MKEHNQRTNTEEINRILGVAHKSLNMQKRKRSDITKAINEKYALVTGRKDILLIQRIKSDFDARYQECFIPEEEMHNLESFIK